MSFDALNKILSNVGGISDSYDSFKHSYDANPVVKKMIKTFDQSGITLDTDAEEPNIPTKKGAKGSSIDTMAKRAAKKRI